MRITIGIYNQNGELVRVLHDEETTPGRELLEWDGRTDAGRRVPPGTYILRVDLKGKGTVARYRIVIE